jgi:hypothetical protein
MSDVQRAKGSNGHATVPRRVKFSPQRQGRRAAINDEQTSRLSRQEYAMRIRHAWQKTVEGIIEAGVCLVEAKKTLDHGEFEKMIEEDLPFTASTARRLMSIARNPVLANRAHVHALPAHWGTLYELGKLKKEVLLALIEDETVTPKMEREEAIALRKPASRSTPHACPICAETKNVPVAHQWSEHDDVEDQSNTAGIVDDLVEEIESIFAAGGNRGLRRKIQRFLDNRVHPDIRAMLADALREAATIANRLADELSQATSNGTAA